MAPPLSPVLARWGVFNLVAMGGFVIQVALISLLTRLAGWDPWLAAAAGVQAALLHNFAGHCRWTWADRPVHSPRALLSRFWRYELVHLTSGVATVTLTGWCVARTGWPPELANLGAVLAFSVVNYLVSDRALFRTAPGTSL